MAGQNSSSQTDFQYFYEDEVFKINKRGQVVFGLVTENFQANSSEEDSDDDSTVKKGEVHVVWHPLGAESIISPSVGLSDRSLMPGDVVRRMIKGKDTQRGYCRDITVSGAVQIVGTNLVLPSVSSERLQPLEKYTTDLAVCLDSWVGTTKIVHSKMHLVTSDGSRVEFPDINHCLLEDYIQRRRRSARMALGSTYISAPDFYPGQILTGQLGMLDEANWIHCTKEMKAARKHRMREQKFTVEKVETESVGVQWQCRALGSGPPGQPRFLIDGEDMKRLKLLNIFEPCTLQLGVRNFITINEDDNFISKGQWKKIQSKAYRNLRRQTRPPKSKESKESVVKDKDGNTQQETTASNKVTFRVSCKNKRRSSLYNRENRTTIQNFHNSQIQLGKNSHGEDSQSNNMDVDIMIVNSDLEQKSSTDLNNVQSVDTESVHNDNITATKTDDLHKLDIPDVAINGKITPEDSSTPSGTPERHRKFRKSRKCQSNSGSNDSLPAVNGDQKAIKNRNNVDSDDWDSSDDLTNSDSCATWSSHCSSSPNNSLRGKRLPQLVTKFLKGKRLKRSAQKELTVVKPQPGDSVVVETLLTTSKANVVWQDGTIELGIPSTELYPIHHLDGQECFPGDFVISGSGTPSMRDYGVVQKVDHHGRTAVVKWFRTYTSCQEPVPQVISESEVSVYDLKDHPDFQYRPGTVVIRVANFTGTEVNCTAGQVIDNYPSGRVNVWWVDGHTSMCWPQDLFKVGEYDSDDGELWAEDGTGSEDSWETQYSGGSGGDRGHRDSRDRDNVLFDKDIEGMAAGEACNIDNTNNGEFPKIPGCLEPRAAAHIERGRVAMAKLEEMFSKNPALQNQEIMRKLLNLYKDCRFLDRLLGTSFFHEDHFQGLLERVRERGNSRDSIPTGTLGTRRVHNQVMRLFSNDELDQAANDVTTQSGHLDNPVVDPNSKPSSQSSPNVKSSKKMSEKVSHSEIKNLGLVGDHFQKVLCSIQVVNCSDENRDNLVHSDLENPPTSTNIDIDSVKDICKQLNKPTDNNISNNSDLNTSVSECSLSKYLTPSGSVSDVNLSTQNDKSPLNANSTISRLIHYEDSGIESQSLSMSYSTNNTSSIINGDLDNALPNESSLLSESTLKVVESNEAKPIETKTSSEILLSTRNVCQRLCSLINVQMMKACSEISRRRLLVLADFLNKVFSKMSQYSSDAPLPYRFSEQYDSIVVTMVGEKDTEIKEATKEIVVVNTENQVPTKEPENLNVELPVNGEYADDKNELELGEGFCVVECAPVTHHFRLSLLQPSDRRSFQSALRRELQLLRSDLPSGVWVRGYEDRMDLFSIMIAGPAKTPYEDGLFMFDVHLGGEFPRAPPMCHYISYCSDRLNPNLYEDGKVCVSLLGTWSGRGVEVWGKDSSLLQVIVSLQGLILCAEPYFNEAGYDKQKGSQQGIENSRMYNEMVLLKLVQSLTKQLGSPPEIFRQEILKFQSRHASGLCKRLESWMQMSEEYVKLNPQGSMTSDSFFASMKPSEELTPDYPLLPVSRGFCLTLRSSLDAYRRALKYAGIDIDKDL